MLLILNCFGLFVSRCTCYSMSFLGLKMLQIKEKNVYTKSKYIKCLQWMFVYFKLLYFYTNLLTFLMGYAHIEKILQLINQSTWLSLCPWHTVTCCPLIPVRTYSYRCLIQTMMNGLEVESQDKYHNMIVYAIRPSKQ